MAISIDFLANASRFLRGSQDTEEALQKVGDSLDDLARDGEQATTKLEGNFRDLAAASKRIDVGHEMGTSFRRGAKESSEAVETAKENIGSNLKEVAASFDGTAQSGIDGFQGLVAEVLEGFGPGGLIAGAVVAGGIGILSSQLQANDEKTQTFREDVAALTQTLIDAGTAQARLGDNLETFATQSDTAKVSLSDIRQQAEQLGVPFERLARAYAQGGQPLQNILDQTNELIAAETVRHQQDQAAVGQNVTLLSGTGARTRALEDQRQKIVDLQKETQAAQKAERDWLAAGGDRLKARSDALDGYVGSVQDYLKQAGASWEDYTTKQGINLDKYNDNIEDALAATRNYQGNVKTATKTLSDDALDYILSLGEDAAPLLQKYVDAPKRLQERTAANWDALGKASATSYTDSLRDGIPDSIKGPRIDLQMPDIPSIVTNVQHYLDSRPLVFRTQTRAGVLAP